MSVIVVGFGDEPLMEACLVSIVDQVEVGDEVILVDHGMTDTPSVAGVSVITPSANTGFGGGCVAGVDASRGDVLVFVNSDATLRPGAIAALTATVADPAVGLAGGLVLLPGEPEVVNSAGLPVHLTGLSWCDGYGEPAAGPYLQSRRLASVAGALFACRRDTWHLLGGMDASYFMYHEDTDLSLRCHLAGLDVVLCPTAVAVHAYEFSRNSDKMFYLERNRFLTVLGDYPAHLLRRVVPVMLALEPLYFLIAIRDGWAGEKLRAWWWLLCHVRAIRFKRQRVQARVRSVRALDSLLTAPITQTQLSKPIAGGLLNLLLHAYWRAASPRPRRRLKLKRRESHRKADVVVLRTNPKDSSLARLLSILAEQHRTTAVVWDRKNNYSCSVNSPRISIRRSTLHGDYYRLGTVLRVMLLQPWFMWSVLRARPKVVHAMDLDTGIIGLLAARLLGVPFVYQCLDPYAASLPQGWPKAIARIVGHIENAVITSADLFVITDLARMPQHEGASPRRVVELPNIPLSHPDPQPFSDSGLLVGYIGSLVPHRSLDVIIDTIGSLREEGVTLQLGGFGPMEHELRLRASQFPNVTFLGWVHDDDLMKTMARFDVFVQIEDPNHPAYRWVSPNKVFESMALGRPIVVADGTLAADRVRETGHGLTVRFGDAEDLRHALRQSLSQPDLKRRLGAAGSRAFSAAWTPAVVTARVLKAYPAPSRTETVEVTAGSAAPGRRPTADQRGPA